MAYRRGGLNGWRAWWWDVAENPSYDTLKAAMRPIGAHTISSPQTCTVTTGAAELTQSCGGTIN